MRDFGRLIQAFQCWDQDAHDAFRSGRPLLDCVLQNRAELIALCEWIEQTGIRSYLEIGVWTGRLTSLLEQLFAFDLLYTCDWGVAEQWHAIHLPEKAQSFWGSSHSIEYMAWRNTLGHIDLIMIDGDHSYEGVKQDFLINTRYPHKYIAFHDIAGASPATEGVRQFWQELKGNKLSFVLPNPDVSEPEAMMGIGIWWPS